MALGSRPRRGTPHHIDYLQEISNILLRAPLTPSQHRAASEPPNGRTAGMCHVHGVSARDAAALIESDVRAPPIGGKTP